MPIYDEWSSDETKFQQAKHAPASHGFDVNIGGREWASRRAGDDTSIRLTCRGSRRVNLMSISLIV